MASADHMQPVAAGKVATIFDDLTKALAQPRRDVRALVGAIALDLASKLVMGLAIGLGVGLGTALAG
jgi:hypothetical protein